VELGADRRQHVAPVRRVGEADRGVAVLDGAGTVTVGDFSWSVTRGDLFVVPSWQPLSVRSEASTSDSDSGALDLFRFSDAPIFERLNLFRTETEGTI
jgi:gentisate 1,2-dioxygenase